MNKKNYIIHNDLSNSSRKRVDIFDNTDINNIKEFNNMNITIEEKFTEGTTTKYYVILKPEVLKGSAKIDFSKYENMDSYERSIINSKEYQRALEVNVQAASGDPEAAARILDNITAIMESNEYINISFCRCPDDSEPNKISDSFIIEYDHGQMQDLKRTIKSIFAAAKKELNIR